jgi:hypothetical protein
MLELYLAETMPLISVFFLNGASDQKDRLPMWLQARRTRVVAKRRKQER